VPRSMPMILPMYSALLGLSVQCQLMCEVVSPNRGLAAGDRDQGGRKNPLPDSIAPLDLIDDFAVGTSRSRDDGNGFMLMWIEGSPDRLDRSYAFAFEQGPQLAVEQRDASIQPAS